MTDLAAPPRRTSARTRAALTARRRAVAAAALLGLLLTAPPASATSPRPDPPHCVDPDGTDINELHGISTRIVTEHCTIVDVGEWWIPAAGWFTNTTYEVVPPDYVPAAPTPIEDFEAKVTHVRYVVDAGTRQERSDRLDADDVMHRGELFGFPITGFIAELGPLPAGPHRVDVYLTLAAAHWDGFGQEPENHVPAGESHWTGVDFDVLPPVAERS